MKVGGRKLRKWEEEEWGKGRQREYMGKWEEEGDEWEKRNLGSGEGRRKRKSGKK